MPDSIVRLQRIFVRDLCHAATRPRTLATKALLKTQYDCRDPGGNFVSRGVIYVETKYCKKPGFDGRYLRGIADLGARCPLGG